MHGCYHRDPIDFHHLTRPLLCGPRMAASGHEDAFPRPMLSARCRFSQGTFAGTRGNGRAMSVGLRLVGSSRIAARHGDRDNRPFSLLPFVLRQAGSAIWRRVRMRRQIGGNRRGHQLQEPVVGGSRRGDGLFVCNGPVLAFTFGVFLKPLMADMGWDRAQASFALSFGGIFSAMMVPVFGCLMDRWSIRKVALPGIAIYVAMVALLALSPRSLLVLRCSSRWPREPARSRPRSAMPRRSLHGSTAAAG